ncbi:MAG: hypothetical protein H6606_06585 [Flavobacteriales bacterium]|nr:hypothetical protein [Flavobacteriales bacterium]
MRTKRNTRRSIAVKIIIGLILANALAFIVARNYVQSGREDVVSIETEQSSILRTGWQVLHWSYSLLEYFKPNPEA